MSIKLYTKSFMKYKSSIFTIVKYVMLKIKVLFNSEFY